jgi:hypothetical protein
MKDLRNICLVIALLFVIGGVMAQEDYNKAQKAPQQKETVLGKDLRTRGGYDSYQAAYKAALREAQQAYPKKNVAIRNLAKGEVKIYGGDVTNYYTYTVVEIPDAKTLKLIEAVNKATSEIDEDNRFALDKITVTDESVDKAKARSQIVNALKDKEYAVVAKEQLEKLYKEQQGQQSGIYNDKTTVQSNNFTAVGYYLSARITPEYIQIQVVNVSTGEIEGDVTENW